MRPGSQCSDFKIGIMWSCFLVFVSEVIGGGKQFVWKERGEEKLQVCSCSLLQKGSHHSSFNRSRKTLEHIS